MQNEQGGETLQGLVTAGGYLQESNRQRPRDSCLRRKMRGGGWWGAHRRASGSRQHALREPDVD